MAELPGIERETLDVDVVIVGAGPAGLAAAYKLAELIRVHNESDAEKKLEGISIAVLEKGKEIGSHGISGAVMDPRGIAELMPDWLERGCPIESPVDDRRVLVSHRDEEDRGADHAAAAAEPRQLRHLPRRAGPLARRRSSARWASTSSPSSPRRACSSRTAASSACAPATRASTRTASRSRTSSRASTSARR